MNTGVDNLQRDFKSLLQKTSNTLFAILLLLFVATASQAQQPASLPQETVKKIEAIVESEKAKLNIPGLSVAIAVNNQLLFSKGFGTSDLENAVLAKATTAYRTASVAKAMTATAVMQLVEQGKIDLDAPMQKYCAAFPEKGSVITVRHLLAHQSGIRHYKNRVEAAGTEHYSSVIDSLKAFKDDPLLFEPGAKYSYTTYGYVVLGCVLEGASGMKYEEYLQKNIFQPAGMERTRVDDVFAIIPDRARGYVKLDINSMLMLSEGARKQIKVGGVINAPLHDTSGKIPGGGLVSTAADLVMFAIAVNAGKLVKQSTLEQMWTEQKAKEGKETGYGFGWNVYKFGEQRVILHGGNQAGARSELRILPDKGIAIAVMTNLSDADIREIMKGLTEALLGSPGKSQTADR
jgi:CubicO group peptidase (beta-lactamase class C family)